MAQTSEWGKAGMPYAYGARATVRLTGLLMAVIVLGLTTFLMIVQFRNDKQAADTKVHRDAHLAATQVAAVFDASAQALQRIEAVMLTTEAAHPGQEVRNIEMAVRDLPPGLMTSVFSSDGTLLMSSLKDPNRGNVADRDYFRELREGRKLVISTLLTDRTSGEQVVVMARRIDRDGLFLGVAAVAIPLKRFVQLSDLLGLDGDATLTLAGMDGRLIVRYPVTTVVDIADSPLYDHVQQSPDGVYDTRSSIDNVERIVGYWVVDGWPVIMAIGIDRETALAAFARQARTAIWLAIPACGAMLWLMYRLLQILKREEIRQQELEIANERASFLLREVHHRVKNNLQTVISLIRMEKVPADVKRSLLSRIAAMAAVHEGIYASDKFETVDVAPYLGRLVGNVAAGYGSNVKIDMDTAHVALSGDRAMQLGLLVNEIVSNAFKHAFREGHPGQLTVKLTEDEPMLDLMIRDNGPGFDPETVVRNMGSRLVEAFAAQLGGDLTIDGSDGTTVRVVFPRVFQAA